MAVIADRDPVHMVRSVVIGVSVVAGHEEAAFKIGDALDPHRRFIHPELSLVVSGIQIVHVQETAGFVVDPGGHIDGTGIRIYCYPAALHLSGIGAEREDPFEFQRVAVIYRDLDVLSFSVHEVLHTEIQLVLVYVDISDVIHFQIESTESISVFRYRVPVEVVFRQCRGTADPVEAAFHTDALSAVYRVDRSQLICICLFGFHVICLLCGTAAQYQYE